MSRDNLKSKLFEAIGIIISECGVENWDGFGALPISPDSVRRMKEYIGDMFASNNFNKIKIGVTPWPTGDLSIDFLKRGQEGETLVSITPNEEDILYIARGKNLSRQGRSTHNINSIYELFKTYFGFQYGVLER